MSWQSHRGRVHEDGSDEEREFACMCAGYFWQCTMRDGTGRTRSGSFREEGDADLGGGEEVCGGSGTAVLRSCEQGAKGAVGARKLYYRRYGGDRRGSESRTERLQRGDVQESAPV